MNYVFLAPFKHFSFNGIRSTKTSLRSTVNPECSLYTVLTETSALGCGGSFSFVARQER